MGVKYHKNESELDTYQILDELVASFADALKALKSEIDGIVISIDEADKPNAEANLGQFIKLFTEKMTYTGQENFLLALAGQQNTLLKLKESHESTPRILNLVTLETLKPHEREEVIETGLQDAQDKAAITVEIAPDAKEMIVDLSEGYPHFIQQFSYSAYEADDDNHISETDVITGAFAGNGALQQLGSKFFTDLYITKIGSDDYRKVLDTMSEFSDAWVKRSDIIEKSHLSEHIIDNALKTLKQRDIIIANEAIRGSYKLPTKAFAAWIKAYSTVSKEKYQ